MTLDDLELLWCQILLEFRDISRVSEAITAKRIVSDGIVAHEMYFWAMYRFRWYRKAFLG